MTSIVRVVAGGGGTARPKDALLVSPDDRPGAVAEKIEDWLGAGTRAVWVVDPETRTVAVHEPGRAARLIGEGGILRGGRLLRGFQLPVREIFG